MTIVTKQRTAPLLLDSPAFKFVLTMGIVNLFADTTYEGGASINGPFMASLGASAAAISIVAGLGEFLGYSLRSVSGYLADRTGKYWVITFIGYAINLLSIPAMALAPSWPVAAVLLIAERVGRALRKPTIEAMLSYTTGTLVKGWVYALNTALDETGATLGPLLMALVLFLNGNYRTGYALLLISSVLAISSLITARVVFPLPARLEIGHTAPEKDFTRAYWLYMIAASFFAAGLMSFELISYHLTATHTVSQSWVPAYLAISTAFGVLASLILGKLYDLFGLPVVFGAVMVSSAFAPFVFFGNALFALFGLLLWGVGYATQDTLFKALIASVLPEGKRNKAFGIFYLGYAVGWLVGSITTGMLYGHSRMALVAFAMLVQLTAVPFFVAAWRGSTARTL